MGHFQDLLRGHLEALGELFECLLSLASEHDRKDDSVQLGRQGVPPASSRGGGIGANFTHFHI